MNGPCYRPAATIGDPASAELFAELSRPAQSRATLRNATQRCGAPRYVGVNGPCYRPADTIGDRSGAERSATTSDHVDRHGRRPEEVQSPVARRVAKVGRERRVEDRWMCCDDGKANTKWSSPSSSSSTSSSSTSSSLLSYNCCRFNYAEQHRTQSVRV